MTDPPHAHASFLDSPPIDVVPGHALLDLTRHSREWETDAVPPPITGVLWTLLVASAGAATWFGLLHFGATTCSALPCPLATWGGRSGLLFWIAVAGVVGLVVSATQTRGLTRWSAGQAALPAVAGAAAFVSVSGLVTVAMLAVAVLAAFLAVLTLLARL